MGIPSYLLNSSLVGVLSQRLLRLNCPHCREAYTPVPAEISLYHEVCGDEETPIFYRGSGCQFCSDRGYLKRTAIHELMPIDESMQELIQKTHNSQQIRKHALCRGMKSLIQDGMERAAKGDTTLSDVIKETYNSNY
jgi:type II secretory ATPase GspE/PulE/Tfp pilus assembly ATPase PilB-like protein